MSASGSSRARSGSSERGGPTPRGRALRRGSFALYLAAATLIPLELALRAFLPQALIVNAPELFEPDAELGWRHRRNARVTVDTGGGGVEFCTDADGDRVSCRARERDCAGRVLVLGDSFVAALAVPWDDTVWRRIEDDAGVCAEVAGVAGYRPSQYLAVARERLRRAGADFDLVLASFYLGNDFAPDASSLPPASDVRRRRFEPLPRGLAPRDLRRWWYPVNQWLETWSHTYVAGRRALRELARRGLDIPVAGVPPSLRRSWLTAEAVESSLVPVRELAAEAHRAGVPLLVVTTPAKLQVLDPDGSELARAFPELAGDLDMDLPNRVLGPRLLELDSVRVVDLLPLLRERASPADWGRFDAHFAPSGHALWFDGVRDAVRAALGLGSATPRTAARSR